MRLFDRIPIGMMLREQIIVVADRYAEAAGIGRKRVSTIVLNRGSKLDDIAEGGDLNTGTFEKAMTWFSKNWPDGVGWPDDVPRPSAMREAAE
ncbi:hypothetical protein [Rhizobium tropici]|nr:hypothetical protein [Rhizobium tropici]